MCGLQTQINTLRYLSKEKYNGIVVYCSLKYYCLRPGSCECAVSTFGGGGTDAEKEEEGSVPVRGGHEGRHGPQAAKVHGPVDGHEEGDIDGADTQREDLGGDEVRNEEPPNGPGDGV